MQKIKKIFSQKYEKYERSKFRKILEGNGVVIAIILALLAPLLTVYLEDLPTKKTSQTLPIIVQEVYFIDNCTFSKITVIK